MAESSDKATYTWADIPEVADALFDDHPDPQTRLARRRRFVTLMSMGDEEFEAFNESGVSIDDWEITHGPVWRALKKKEQRDGRP